MYFWTWTLVILQELFSWISWECSTQLATAFYFIIIRLNRSDSQMTLLIGSSHISRIENKGRRWVSDSVICYIAKQKESKFWKKRYSSDNISLWPPLITWNSGQHFAGNSELFPVWRPSLRNVAQSWHLAGNSFIVRSHATMNYRMNWQAVRGKTPAKQFIVVAAISFGASRTVSLSYLCE